MAIVWYVLFAFLYILKSSEAQTLSLSVTPPSPVVGQEVTFTCTASQDFTASTSVFYKRNTVLVGQFNVNSTSCTSIIPTGQNLTYTLTCGFLPTRQLSLTMPSAYVTEDGHGTDWTCQIFLGAVSNTVQLTISVPVSMVTITTDGVYRPSVTVSAGNTRTFTCTTTASRPVARLSWFRGDNNITDQAGTATDQGAGDDKYTRQQSLTITGRVNDVYSGLKCEAVNIEGRTPVSSQTSKIIVHWEPQTDPVLTRDPPTTTLTEGVSVTLTCQQTGGKPLATLSWSGVCSGTTPTESRDTTTVTSRVQLSVNRTYNGQTCTCESRHPVNSYLKSLSETFLVLFGPDTVTVTGNQQIVADGVRHLTLTCVTAPYHQYVTLTWKRGNILLPGASSPSNTSTAYGTVTSQVLTLTPDRTWDGDTISCTAETIGTAIQSTDSVQLDLLYIPKTDVSVGGYDQNTPLTETTIVSMYCTVRGGKPEPTLTFTCPGIIVTHTVGDDGATHYSNITFTAVRQLNGQQCSCTGSQSNNQWTDTGKSHVLNVLFGPDTVTVTGNQQIVADGVRHLTLTCMTAPYHQYVTLTWKRGNTVLTGVSSPSNTSTAYGTVTSQVITLTPDRTWDGDTISCSAETIGTAIQSTDSVQLDLLFQPYITVSSVPPSPIIEGRELALTCDVDSNPISTVVWSRPGGQSISGTSRSGGIHVIPSVSRHDDGIYRCTASNSLQTNTLDTLITVYYSSDNISVTYRNLTDDDTRRELRCIPDGNPRLFKFSKWQHQSIYGQLIREIDGVTSGQESVMIIPDPGLDTRYQDTGYYVCRVENGVPDMNNQSVFSRSVYVSVKSPPVFVADQSLFTGQQEHAAVITVPFYTPTGYQQVELTKGNTNMDNQFILSTIPANVSVPFFGSKFTVRGFLTVISVQKLRESDFGSYVLTVTNDDGSQQFEFDLKETAASASAKDSSMHDTGVAMLSTGVVLLLINIGILGCLIIRKGRLSITNKTTTSKPEATMQFAELTTSRRGNGEEERSTYEEIGKTDRSELALDSPACDASEYENTRDTRVHSQGNSAYESLQERQKPNVYEELASPRNDDTGDNEYSNTDTREETS